MIWKGKWRNQYGSLLEISDDSDQKIVGTFRTALDDSGFHDQAIPMFGVHQGDCISVSGGGRTPSGDAVVCYTGLLRNGKMETLWFVCADSAIRADEGQLGKIVKLNWWRSMTTSADTFERVS